MNNEALTDLLHRRLPEANKTRCHRWHGEGGVNDWTTDKWTVATLGELGETANALKKLWRVRANMANISDADRQLSTEGEALAKIAEEFGDTMIYYDLLLQHSWRGYSSTSLFPFEEPHSSEKLLRIAGFYLCQRIFVSSDVRGFRSAMLSFAAHPEININPVEAIVNKFNATSIKYGFPERL